MNYISHRRLRLAARNEGKIKSYESCVDVRAWSHDMSRRNCYLRDWIKCKMPICVVPVCTLSSILSIMTCSSRGKVTSRCNSRCQSKVLLSRLSSSCTVMKDCLSKHKEFEKYFREEDLETVNWPCERCLEIFKSVKVFWKIVIEKVLNINLPKCKEYKSSHFCSIGNIAKEWQQEMLDEALYIKTNGRLSNHNNTDKTDSEWERNCEDKCLHNKCQAKATKTDCEFRTVEIQTDKSMRQKINKSTFANIKMVNLDTKCPRDKENEVIMLYKNNIKNLQHQYNEQKNEVDRLKKENLALNVELQWCRQHHLNKPYNCNPCTDNTMCVNSQESYEFDKPKDVESEMIITLKNCKNENFRHVSVIQVLHKTNEFDSSDGDHFNADEPLDVLNKVYETLAGMVNREISIACKKDDNLKDKNIIIKSTFHNISETKSTPSCCMSSYSFTSSKFESANGASTNKLGK